MTVEGDAVSPVNQQLLTDKLVALAPAVRGDAELLDALDVSVRTAAATLALAEV